MNSHTPGTAVVKRVDKCERKGSSDSTGQDVLSELLVLRCVLGGFEHGLNGVLESEVQGLCGEVPDDVGHVTWEIKNKAMKFKMNLSYNLFFSQRNNMLLAWLFEHLRYFNFDFIPSFNCFD